MTSKRENGYKRYVKVPRIHTILGNEKYTGNALLQKRYRNN